MEAGEEKKGLLDQLDVLAGAVERVGLSTIADAFDMEGREGAFSRYDLYVRIDGCIWIWI
jgi:hypothetical protein